MCQTSGVRPGLAWALAEAGLIPTTATPPANSAPAIIRFRVLWVLTMRAPLFVAALRCRLYGIVRQAGTGKHGAFAPNSEVSCAIHGSVGRRSR
jgi:hypothetical protein